ncbi:MAG: lamin tail domain-containing protein [Candidatus Woesearchaeota archaeon]
MIGLKIVLVLFVFAVCSAFAFANVQISEVLYDPVGTESGGEAVELYNPTGSDIDISGYKIRSETSMSDAVVQEGTVMSAGSYFLIADAGWSTSKDNPLWANADHEEAITLTNSDAGIALIDNNDNIIDAVGWGDPNQIDAGLFEGTPSSGAGTGNSLIRNQDSGNNAVDFEESAPDLKNSNSASGGLDGPNGTFSAKIAFTVTVTNPVSRIKLVNISDEDPTKNGTQIIPNPKNKKLISVEIVASNDQGHDFIGDINAVFNGENISLNKSHALNQTDAIFSKDLALDFYDDPGEYNLTFFLLNNTENSSLEFQIDYESLTAYELDTTSLECNVRVGKKCEVSGDLNISSNDQATLRNIGNINLDFEVFGSNLVSGNNVIEVGNLKYSFSDYPFQVMQINPVLNDINLDKGEMSMIDLSFELEIPSGTKSGSYISDILLNGVESW